MKISIVLLKKLNNASSQQIGSTLNEHYCLNQEYLLSRKTRKIPNQISGSLWTCCSGHEKLNEKIKMYLKENTEENIWFKK